MEGEREKKRKGRMNESVRNKLCKREREREKKREDE